MSFKKAVRKKVKLKLALTGVSGSGKTLSALLVAKGIGGKIALIDTENGSGSLYAGNAKFGTPEFDTLELTPPYTTDKYIAAINEAVKAGYGVVIVDSLSHQWAGEGGLLQKKEQLDARGGNSYTNWAKMTPEHEKFKAAILHSDIHLIGTLRSKQDYVVETNEKGKQAPRKVGLAPVQRDGMEYEFTCVLDLDNAHQAQASKDRTGLFDGKLFVPSEATGRELMAWLDSGHDAPPVEPPKPGEFDATDSASIAPTTKPQVAPEPRKQSPFVTASNIPVKGTRAELEGRLTAAVTMSGLSGDQIKEIAWDTCKKTARSEMTDAELAALIEELKKETKRKVERNAAN